MNREAIYAKVFTFFSGLTTGGSPAFKTATRRMDTWDRVQAEDQPALLMSQRSEVAGFRKGLPIKWTLDLDLFLYVHTGALQDSTVVPSSILNPLLDLIEHAMQADDPMDDLCTLGGLVERCSYSGSIQVLEGTLGNEAVAVIPIQIVVPAT